MVRPDTARRRVSNLVGRFEQLAQTPPIRFSDPSPPESISPTSPRPASHHGEKFWQQHERRTFSLSSLPVSLEARLDKELQRNKQLRDECEVLRRRCYQDDERVTALCRKLEEGTEMQQSLHVQTSGLQTKVDRLADKLAHRDQVQRAEYERRIKNVANERDILAARVRAAEGAVQRAQIADERAEMVTKQAHALRAQLLKLKTDVAARRGSQEVASDQEIFEMMNTFHHLVQNWVVNTFRKVKLDPLQMESKFNDTEALREARMLRKLYATFDTNIKIFILQATVVRLLMSVFNMPFFGLPESLKGLGTAALAMQSPTTTFTEWRQSTAELLSQADTSLSLQCEQAYQLARDRMIEEVCATMSALTGSEISNTQRRTLSAVIEHAISLSRLFDRQHALYQCWLPDLDDSDLLEFDVATMEDLMDEQEEEGPAKDLRCVAFPALLKTMCESNGKMDRIVIMKAKVLTEGGNSIDHANRET